MGGVTYIPGPTTLAWAAEETQRTRELVGNRVLKRECRTVPYRAFRWANNLTACEERPVPLIPIEQIQRAHAFASNFDQDWMPLIDVATRPNSAPIALRH